MNNKDTLLIIFGVFYNRATQVKASVSSLLKSAPSNSIIVLVDDGSTENTFDELKKFEVDNRVVVFSQTNKGFVKTLTTVIPIYIDLYNPEYISIFGAGDICLEDKYTKQIKYLNENKDVVALGTGHQTISYNNKTIVDEVKGYFEASEESLYKKTPFTHGTVIYRTEAYKRAGGYNPLFKYCQDWDLYFRLIKQGKVVRYPEVLYKKYIFSDGASFKPLKKIEQIKYSKIATSRKHSERVYNEYLLKLKKYGIEGVFNDEKFSKEYRNAQLKLILKGELNLAREFVEIINKEKKYISQLLIDSILKFLIYLKFPSKLLASTYRIVHSMKSKIGMK